MLGRRHRREMLSYMGRGVSFSRAGASFGLSPVAATVLPFIRKQGSLHLEGCRYRQDQVAAMSLANQVAS